MALLKLCLEWPGILHGLRFAEKLVFTLFLSALAANATAGVALLYHHVDATTPAITSIEPDQFEKHLLIIEELGYEVIPLADLVTNATGEGAAARQLAITFDDAYASIYTQAFPRLRSRNWPFTIFVAPALVKESNYPYLNWAKLAEMAKHGASIQNHTQTHAHLVRYLPNETKDAWRTRVTKEITEARDVLREQGYQTTQFAYPYGEYNLELLEITRELGLVGFGQQSGAIGPLSNRQLLPRFPLAGIYVGEAAFRDKLRSLALPVVHPDIEPLVEGNYRPSLTLDFVEPDISVERLTCYGPGGLMNREIESSTRVVITPVDEISVGRTRYNCTLPKANRYFWFSQLWLRKKPDGTWYPEP